MSRNPKSAGADVENYTHGSNKRRNIPTAELQKLVPDDDKAVKRLKYRRNTDLDPQLVWRGKDQEDEGPLIADAPPVYIQEKIHPRALIEDLRRRSKARAQAAAPQVDLFHDFNGLADPEAKTEFYAHDQNWSNRMILGDSLLVMASLAEREALRGKVQMIYLDPPYGIKFNSNWQPSTKSRDVKDGKEDNVSREPEVVRAFRDTWKNGIHSYLSYLRERLTLVRDLLTDSGSIFVQIGDENVHIVRALMDEVFGAASFVVTIPVKKKGSQISTALDPVNDYVLWFAKASRESQAFKSYPLFSYTSNEDALSDYPIVDIGDDRRWRIADLEKRDGKEYREDFSSFQHAYPSARIAGLNPLKSGGYRKNQSLPLEFQGRTYHLSDTACWKHTVREDDGSTPGMTRLAMAGRLVPLQADVRFLRYAPNPIVKRQSNWWDNLGGASSPIYIVQTNEEIVKRCLLMTTDPGDLVLDPTCGSGTTAYVAEQWGRRWITVDTSRVALTLARARLMGARYDYYLLRDSVEGANKDGELTGRPPSQRTYTNDVRHGFVYDQVKWSTSGSIANNAEIDVIWKRRQKVLEPLRAELNAAAKQSFEEWQIPREASGAWSAAAKAVHAKWREGRRARQKEIDDSIARNADVELLYDRPYKAKNVVRVAGPFTVESLSPHRMLPLGEDPYLAETLTNEAERAAAPLPPATAPETDFAQVVYENLKAAGVQNTKKGERLSFEWIKPFVSKSKLIAFEGRYKEGEAEKRAAIVIGPEYDTVGYELVRRAAREAADLFDTLIVCGFAFAPEVDDSRLNFGALTVLKARMNQDLRMGDRLKATGAGNLFVVFGEPDIRIEPLPDGMLRVEIKGMDIFDPTTGEVRSSGGKELMNDVAAWFIDDDYDEESFFVRQAYFVGQDPYEGLRRALKAEIDETAWTEISSTVSQPFARPASGKICVKVINHFGDEVQKVFEV